MSTETLNLDIPQIVSNKDAPTGELGQQYLATGKAVALRRWDEQPGQECEPSSRHYETVGYVVSGQLEVEIDGQRATLGPGDSWLVPAETCHRYRVIKPLVAIEATSPPARFADRDLPLTDQ
ncbi:MAG: cupin domain-containing protein [Pirellulaceae bacterium]|nr:cupin domain-containing protein [Pirellulaceae bacterium]